MPTTKTYCLTKLVASVTLFALCRFYAEAQGKARSVTEACSQQKPVLWKNGLRYAEQFPKNVQENVLRCLSTTASAAKQFDAQMDAVRQEALKAILPKGTPSNKLSQAVCEIAMRPVDGSNEVVKRKAVMTACMKKEVETKGVDAPSLDMRAIQSKCLKCAFPKLPQAEALARYQEVVKAFERLEEDALRTNFELEAAMRFTLDEGPSKEMNDAARTSCLKTMAPGVTSNQYVPYVMSLFKKGDLETKKKIDACTYKNSLKGKWVHARQMMIRSCALAAQKQLPANLQNDLNFLYALHLNATALNIYLSCAEHEEDTIVDGPTAPGGPVDVYCTSNGKAPPKCPQCASDVYTTVDAAKVESTVDACYGKKESAHPLYKEYTAYLGRLKATSDTQNKCLHDVLGAQRAKALAASHSGKKGSSGSTKTG